LLSSGAVRFALLSSSSTLAMAPKTFSRGYPALGSSTQTQVQEKTARRVLHLILRQRSTSVPSGGASGSASQVNEQIPIAQVDEQSVHAGGTSGSASEVNEQSTIAQIDEQVIEEMGAASDHEADSSDVEDELAHELVSHLSAVLTPAYITYLAEYTMTLAQHEQIDFVTGVIARKIAQAMEKIQESVSPEDSARAAAFFQAEAFEAVVADEDFEADVAPEANADVNISDQVRTHLA